MAYTSEANFDSARIRAAAVYCSDGRFGEQVDDLLHNRLHLPRYDRLAVPGGGACLAGHFATHREEEVVLSQLQFLVEAHQLERVVLIAHEDCAFYTQRLNISAPQLEAQQREDLVKAIRRVRTLAHGVSAEAWFARRQGDRIAFDLVSAV